MSTLKVNSIEPTSGTDVTVGGNVQLGNKNVTTTGIVTTSQINTTGDVSFGGDADFNTNSLTEVGSITGTGTISGFGAMNGTNATLTGTLTMDGTNDIVMTASDGKIVCKSLEVDGSAITSASQPLKAFGRISVDTVAASHTVSAETGNLNIASVAIAGTTVTINFTSALSGTTYVVMTTTSAEDCNANPGTRGTSSVEIAVTEAKIYTFDFLVVSL